MRLKRAVGVKVKTGGILDYEEVMKKYQLEKEALC